MKRRASVAPWSAALVVTLALGLTQASAAQNPCSEGGSPSIVTSGSAADGVGGTGLRDGSDDGVAGTGLGDHDDGVAGTGIQADAGEGVGGTGIDGTDDGGIGGTGIAQGPGPQEGGVGGTGILGVVTGFASICVGGNEVHYDGATSLLVDGVESDPTTLAVGRVVEIEALDSDGQLRARSIVADHVVIGPIDAVDHDNGRLQLLGQSVQISDDTRVSIANVERDIDMRSWKRGDWIAVDGLRRDDGVIVASLIGDVPHPDAAQLIGPVESVTGQRALVAGVTVITGDNIDLQPGTTVRIAGRWHDNALTATEVHSRTLLRDRRIQRLELEAYMEQPPATDTVRIGELAVQLTPSARRALARVSDRQRVRFDVTIRPDGALIGQSAIPLRPLPPPRPARPGLDFVPREGERPNPNMERGDHRPPNVDHGGKPPHPPQQPHFDRPPPRVGSGPPRPPIRPPFHPHDMRPPGVDVPPPRPPMPPPHPPRR